MKKYSIWVVAILLTMVCFGAFAAPPSIGVKGGEGGEATIYIRPDEGDDTDDKMRIVGTTTGNLSFRGTSGTNEVASLDMSTGTLTLDGGITGSGALSGTTISGSGQVDVGSLADVSIASAAATTNGQAVTLSGLTVRLNSSLGANNGTNTITLANLAPSAADSVFFVINSGSSNALAIAQSGTFKSPALELAPYEACWIGAASSNAFYASDSD